MDQDRVFSCRPGKLSTRAATSRSESIRKRKFRRRKAAKEDHIRRKKKPKSRSFAFQKTGVGRLEIVDEFSMESVNEDRMRERDLRGVGDALVIGATGSILHGVVR